MPLSEVFASPLGNSRVAEVQIAQVRQVVQVAERRREQLRTLALGILLPRHGIAVLGHDLNNAYDTLERLESNARCVLLSRLLPPVKVP